MLVDETSDGPRAVVEGLAQTIAGGRTAFGGDTRVFAVDSTGLLERDPNEGERGRADEQAPASANEHISYRLGSVLTALRELRAQEDPVVFIPRADELFAAVHESGTGADTSLAGELGAAGQGRGAHRAER